MLLRHQKADGTYVYEKPYNLYITEISCGSGDGLSFSGYTLGTAIAPYGAATINVSTSSATERGVFIKFVYHYSGKDGQQIGDDMTSYTYTMVSDNQSNIGNEWKDNYTKEIKVLGIGTTYLNFDLTTQTNWLVTNPDNFESTVNNIWMSVNNNADRTPTITAFTHNGMNSTYFTATSTSAFLNVDGYITKSSESNPGRTFLPFKAKTGVTLASGSSYALGTLTFSMKNSNYTGTLTPDFGNVYYCDMEELIDTFNQANDADRVPADFENATTEWNNYVSAMKAAAKLVRAPKMTGTFATVYTASNISTALTNLENAIDALDAKAKPTVASTAALTTALAATEVAPYINNADKQINYQDYKLYAYWKYEDNRTTARNWLKEYEGPQMPGKYIDGCGLTEAEIGTVAANEANATKAQAILDSRLDPSEFDMQEYWTAVDEYTAPTYTKLQIDDLASKLQFHAQFLKDRDYSFTANAVKFLGKEIASANAKGYVSTTYTDVSWQGYSDALTKATTIYNSPASYKNSEIFEAKYELQKAQRKLLEKANSYADVVGYDEIEGLFATAEAYFANASYFTAVDGTLDTEWADLISAVGYKGIVDANEVQLYNKSAQAFVDRQENYYPSYRNDIDAADLADKIQAALDALECAVQVVAEDGTSTIVDQTVNYISNIAPLSLVNADSVLAYVTTNYASDPNVKISVNKTSYGYGTGTRVDATVNGLPIATYFVVIYGDLNGDDAIDAFDAAAADRALTSTDPLSDVLAMAANVDKSANGFADNDIGLIQSAAVGKTTIAQN